MLSGIFDLFTQADTSQGRSQSGLGIGLTLVRSLVEMHGGTVEASSDGQDRGSEFVVRLPLLLDSREPDQVAAGRRRCSTAASPADSCRGRQRRRGREPLVLAASVATTSEPLTRESSASRRRRPSGPTSCSSTSACPGSAATRWPEGFGGSRARWRRPRRRHRIRTGRGPPDFAGGRLRSALGQTVWPGRPFGLPGRRGGSAALAKHRPGNHPPWWPRDGDVRRRRR